MLITLGIYYLTPWLRWDRGPYAPDQAVLVDLANRRFYFFFIEIWPQEFYYVAGLLVMAGFGLFLVTSTVGRAWCGYTCPQTVWVDLFLVVERAIEGDRNARIKLDDAPWSSGTSSVQARFQAPRSGWSSPWRPAVRGSSISPMRRPCSESSGRTGPPVAYITIAILTATTYIFGGLMREQVCTYMCPWPRIQAAMLDEHSLTVTYNDWRGEPRSRHAKKAMAEGQSRSAIASTATPASSSARWASTWTRSRRPAARMHHLRAVHRCLRRRDGQAGGKERSGLRLISYAKERSASSTRKWRKRAPRPRSAGSRNSPSPTARSATG
jgi:hypothetical protein